MVGPGQASDEQCAVAERVGRLLAQRGATVICGGLGGVMEAACRGATDEGGIAVGILADSDRADANPHVTVAIATGLGEARNAIVARSADVLIAVGGEYGTLSEVAMALKSGRRVIGIDTWDIDGVEPASGPDEAVQAALERLA